MIRSCIIVGAGLAGVSTAESLRYNGFDGRLTMLGAEAHAPYDRPPLSKQMLLDGSTPVTTPLRPESFYSDNDIELVREAAVTELCVDTLGVSLADGRRMSADRIVLATGGSPRALRLPGAELAGVATLRRSEDAVLIRDYLSRGGHVVVIGGGFIGTEVAAAASAHGCATTIVEADALPLVRTLGRDVAERVTDTHRRRGVTVRTGVSVDHFEGGDRLTGVRLADGTLLPADLAVIGVGMRPEAALAEQAGLATRDGVLTDPGGQTSHPSVFAAGDVARFTRADGTHTRVEHWQNANTAGPVLASAMLDLPAPPPSVPWFWSDQFDLNIQMAGTPRGGDATAVRGDLGSEEFSVIYHRDGQITGITAVNRGKDVRPTIELIKRGPPVALERLTDEGLPMRKVLKAATTGIG